jgi:hypothetical protein
MDVNTYDFCVHRILEACFRWLELLVMFLHLNVTLVSATKLTLLPQTE